MAKYLKIEVEIFPRKWKNFSLN